MAPYKCELDGQVAVVTMQNGENRFNLESIAAFSRILEQIVSQTEAKALVVTSADEKIWCNGIDLNWLLPQIEQHGPAAQYGYLSELYTLFKRILSMPMITVAALNGHAFAGGAFLAFALDFRFMQRERGWICIPEVDLGIPLGPVFLALTKRVVAQPLLEEMQYTARRLTAEECLSQQVITRACDRETVLKESLAFAKDLNKPRDIITKMKQETLQPIIDVIDQAIADCRARIPAD